MLALLSPSKTLDLQSKIPALTPTRPALLADAKLLAAELRTCNAAKLSALMGISARLAELNAERYRAFKTPFTAANARPAIFTFKGDVYDGIEVESYSKADLAFAQAHIRILSGLYGVLRPLDLMQPYRLEMGTKLKNPRGGDLYDFWGAGVTDELNAALAGQASKTVLNLASQEYFSAVRPGRLAGPLIHVQFKEKKAGGLKIVGLFAKRARGEMAHFIIRERLDDPASIKDFHGGGYRFQRALSTPETYVFTR